MSIGVIGGRRGHEFCFGLLFLLGYMIVEVVFFVFLLIDFSLWVCLVKYGMELKVTVNAMDWIKALGK